MADVSAAACADERSGARPSSLHRQVDKAMRRGAVPPREIRDPLTTAAVHGIMINDDY
jgi:hypothetical protein